MKNKIFNILKKNKPLNIVDESPYTELLTYYLKEYHNLTEDDKNIIRQFFKIHTYIIPKND